MIRAIFFDLDGTLLDNDKRITASAYEALEKCRVRGIALFVATVGRVRRAVIFRRSLL